MKEKVYNIMPLRKEDITIWTPEEDELLAKLYNDKKHIVEILTTLNKNIMDVMNRLCKNKHIGGERHIMFRRLIEDYQASDYAKELERIESEKHSIKFKKPEWQSELTGIKDELKELKLLIKELIDIQKQSLQKLNYVYLE